MVNLQKILFYRTNSPMIMKLGIEHFVLKLFKVYINDDPEVDLDLFDDNVKFGETYFCTYSRPRYQVSVYRTIVPLVFNSYTKSS